MAESIFNLPEGQCSLRIPENLSAESSKDLGDWLELVLHAASRTIALASVPVTKTPPPVQAAPPPAPARLTEIEEGTGISRHRLTTIIYKTHRGTFFGCDFPGKHETAWALAKAANGKA